MRDLDIRDNKYPVGTIVYAKTDPQLKLVIDAYKQRIYYCAVVDRPDLRQLAYFERELIDPLKSGVMEGSTDLGGSLS